MLAFIDIGIDATIKNFLQISSKVSLVKELDSSITELSLGHFSPKISLFNDAYYCIKKSEMDF
ncbi:MAG: hypothetical protein DRP02_06840 [Candidatus Gerdarchaeota archaeon]|nr:MAG: hypothetical protein DRO63_03595 [Candidatus Gerdarchaeota archaeon]RLI70760.1 MAG: hypothetical protein DRP02_06840 [Candidatus Gerdarchaeota archaeon]